MEHWKYGWVNMRRPKNISRIFLWSEETLKTEMVRSNSSDIRNIVYLNCVERYKEMHNHRSFIHNSGGCENKTGNKYLLQRDPVPIQAWFCFVLFCFVLFCFFHVLKRVSLHNHRSLIHNSSSCENETGKNMLERDLVQAWLFFLCLNGLATLTKAIKLCIDPLEQKKASDN